MLIHTYSAMVSWVETDVSTLVLCVCVGFFFRLNLYFWELKKTFACIQM